MRLFLLSFHCRAAALLRTLPLLLFLSVLRSPLGATTVTDIPGAFARAEAAEMRGNASVALDLHLATLERVAALPPADGVTFGPELETILRRVYRLGRATGRHTEILPVLQRWMRPGDDAPAALSPVIADLARFYAGAVTLHVSTDVQSAERVWAPLGFLGGWWVIGPFDNERGGGFGTAAGAEADRMPATSVSHPGKGRQVAWRDLPVKPVTGWVDLDALMHPDDQALAYAMTFIECERDVEAALHLGTDEGYRIWLNGELVGSRDVHRVMRFDQDTIGVRLHRGWNSLLIKVAEDEGRWEFRVRVGAPGGGPLEGWKEAWPAADAELPPTPSAHAGGEDAAANVAPVRLPARSMKELERRIESDPANAWNHYLAGTLRHEIRAHDVSEHPDRESFRRALQLHGDSAPASYHYFFAQASRKRRGVTADRDDNAWRLALEHGTRVDSPSLLAMVDLARHALDTFGNLLRAETLLRAALAQNPELVEARLLLGRIHARRGFPAALQKAHATCRELGLRSPHIVRHHASELRKAGRLAAAERTLREELARDRLSRATRTDLVALLVDQDRIDEALELLRDAIRRMPFDLPSRREIVRFRRGRGKIELALAAQREIVAIAVGDPVERRREGDLLWQLDRRDEALGAWKLALEIQPNFPELREYLDFVQRRRDAFVEEFRRDLAALIEARRADEIIGDDPVEYLLDHSVIEVNPDGTSKEFTQELFRINNDAGARLHDHYRTYYAAGDERLEFKVVRVIHPDGREERSRLRSFAGSGGGQGTFRSASIDMPPLHRGDLVEVQYVREEVRQSFFGDYFGHREYFRSNYPVAEKTFTLRVPAGRAFHFHQRGLDAVAQVDRNPDRETTTYRWRVTDVARLEPEPGMPPNYETLPLLEISTFQSWDDFSAWYENLIRKQFESSPELRATVQELTSGKTTDIERIEALYHFVVQEIRYNAWEFGVHGFKPYNASTIFARKFGDCKDKATLLTTMLREVGITSYPVLIRATESRGEEDLGLPMVHHFNHCITYVPGGEGREGMFLDGTAQYNAMNELPGSDRGARVLVVKPDRGDVVTVPWNTPDDLTSLETVHVTVGADRGAVLDIRVEARGEYASSLRRYFEVAGQRKRNLERIFGSRFAGLEIEEQTFSDLADLAAPVEFRVRLRVPDFVQPSPEGLSLRPLDDFFQTNKMFQSLVTLEERDEVLILGNPRRSRLQVTCELPGGHRVKTIPESIAVEGRFGRLSVAYDLEDNRFVFTRLLEITSPRVTTSDYPRFRMLAAALERLREEKVVFEAVQRTRN